MNAVQCPTMAAASGLSETMTLDDDSGAHEGNDEDNGDDAYGIESHGEQDAIARQVQLLLDLDRLGQIIARNRSNSADFDVLCFLCSARPWLFAAGRTGPAAPGSERADRLHLPHVHCTALPARCLRACMVHSAICHTTHVRTGFRREHPTTRVCLARTVLTCARCDE